jgi:hypothetical protein
MAKNRVRRSEAQSPSDGNNTSSSPTAASPPAEPAERVDQPLDNVSDQEEEQRRRPLSAREKLSVGYGVLVYVLFLAIMISSFVYPVAFAKQFPNILPAAWAAIPSLRGALPPHAESLQQAWALGGIQRELSLLPTLKGAHASRREALLLEASSILQLPSDARFDESDLELAFRTMRDAELHGGIVSRVTGAFSVVGTLWTVGIIGIALTLAPAVYALAEVTGLLKLLRGLLAALSGLLLRLWASLLRPLWHIVSAPLWYYLVLCFVQQAAIVYRADPHGSASTYLALTAFAMLWLQKHPSLASVSPFGHKDRGVLYAALFFLVACSTLAVGVQSRAMGFVAVATLESIFGFFIALFPRLYVIGFAGESQMQRAKIASFLLLVISAALQILQRNAKLSGDGSSHS